MDHKDFKESPILSCETMLSPAEDTQRDASSTAARAALKGACVQRPMLPMLQGLGYPPMPSVPEPAPAAEPISADSAGDAHRADFLCSVHV